MKIWNVLTLLVFLNFTALPGIAVVFGFEIPATNMVIQEEETQSHTYTLFEKTLPTPFDLRDFIDFCHADQEIKGTPAYKERFYFNPHLSHFSPPPEIFS